MEAPGPCHLLDGLAAEKRAPRGAGWPWGVSSFFTSEATFPGRASVSPFQHFLTARAAPQSRNLGSVSLPWSLSCCASVSMCFVEKLERGVPGEATSEPRPPQDGDSLGPRAAGEGWREQDSEQPQAGRAGRSEGHWFPEAGASGASCASLTPSRAWGDGPIRGQAQGPLEEGECVGSQHPSSKERQEAAPGVRKRKRPGSGGCGHGVRPGGAAGGEKKAWLRADLAPRPPPHSGPSALPPALPCPASCVPGGETDGAAGARARGDGAAVSSDLRGPAATSGESPSRLISPVPTSLS